MEKKQIPNVRWLCRSPRKYDVDMSKDGVLQFRHPWVVELLPPDAREGPGVVVRRSFAKLKPDARGSVLMAARHLMETAPKRREEALLQTHPRLLDAYFKPIEEIEEVEGSAVLVKRVSSPNSDPSKLVLEIEGIRIDGSMLSNPAAFFKLGSQIQTLVSAMKELGLQARHFHRENQDLKRLLVQKDRQLNKHVTATLGEALAAFEKDYRPGDPQTKKDVLSTVRKFVHGGKAKGDVEVKGLGATKKLVDVTAHDVDAWIDNYPGAKRVSSIHRRSNLSNFFKTCQRVFDMSSSPFTSGKLKSRGDLLRIYKKRPKLAIKRIQDLKMLLAALDDNLYWQSWVAFACLAGPRWHEQQALLTRHLDLEAIPPRITFQATAESDIKTIGNAIPIERMVLLPIMRRFAETWEPQRAFLWPSLAKTRNRKGRRQPMGCWSHTNFTRHLKKALKEARERSSDRDHELWSFGPDEWRHTFGTLLALSGKNATEIAKWMRDSAEVAAASYIDFNPTDERVGGDLSWDGTVTAKQPGQGASSKPNVSAGEPSMGTGDTGDTGDLERKANLSNAISSARENLAES